MFLIHTELTMRFSFLSLVFLLSLIDVTIAEGNNYEEFLPLDELNESEWNLGNSVTATSVDLVDADLFEYPFELNDQELPQVIASNNQGCSSGGTPALNRLRPRGDDDYCGSNLGPQERPLIIPNLSTLKLESFCPNKFGPLASNLVCASKDPQNVQSSSLFNGISLLECESGMFPVLYPFLETKTLRRVNHENHNNKILMKMRV